MEEDHEQRRGLRLEAPELFVKQHLSANLVHAAARRRGNLFRQQFANEKYTNDMASWALNTLSGEERQEFIHFAETKLLEPPRATGIFTPVVSAGAGASSSTATSAAATADTSQPAQQKVKSSYSRRPPIPTSPVEEFSPTDPIEDVPSDQEVDSIQEPSQATRTHNAGKTAP